MIQNRFYTFLYIYIFIFVSGCFSSTEIELERAKKSEQSKNMQQALAHYTNLVQRDETPDLTLLAAKRAAHIAHYDTKDFQKAMGFYRLVLVKSHKIEEQIEAQKNIATITFEHYSNYKRSVTEYNRLIEMPIPTKDIPKYRFRIAQAYFYTGNFYQSSVEVDKILNNPSTENEQRFSAMQLKANIYLSTQKLDLAIQWFKKIIESFPEKSKKENVFLNLAVCYEEKKDFDKAIETLSLAKQYHVTPDFIDLRIQRLKMRKSYLPGAKGLKK